MTIDQFVTIILMACGPNDLKCWDYYNNCVHNKSVELKMENMIQCKDERTKKALSKLSSK